MPARHRSRHRALQVLFLWDQRHQAIDEAIGSFYDTLGSEEDNPGAYFARWTILWETLVRGAAAHSSDIDKQIIAKSENWRIERMPAVDRNILRLGVKVDE